MAWVPQVTLFRDDGAAVGTEQRVRLTYTWEWAPGDQLVVAVELPTLPTGAAAVAVLQALLAEGEAKRLREEDLRTRERTLTNQVQTWLNNNAP